MGYKKFCDLSDEDKLKIIKAKMAGNIEVRVADRWYSQTTNMALVFNAIYRVKPTQKKSLGYRRYLYKIYRDSTEVAVEVVNQCTWSCTKDYESLSCFIKWIDTEWQYEIYEEQQ